jgi:hypothetical protein
MLRPRVLGGLVVIWVLLAFFPVVQNDFVNWDDYALAAGALGHRSPWRSGGASPPGGGAPGPALAAHTGPTGPPAIGDGTPGAPGR